MKTIIKHFFIIANTKNSHSFLVQLIDFHQCLKVNDEKIELTKDENKNTKGDLYQNSRVKDKERNYTGDLAVPDTIHLNRKELERTLVF